MDLRCRICLAPSPVKNIFKARIKCEDTVVKCHNVMSKLLSLSVSVDDGISRRICRKCYVKLSRIHKLKILADKSYLILLDRVLKQDENRVDKMEECPRSHINDKAKQKIIFVDVPIKLENEIGDEITEDNVNDDDNKPLSEFIPKGTVKCEISNGMSWFFCSFCGKGFKSRSSRYLHTKRVHEKVRRFLCDYCSMGFFMKKELEDHIRSHTKELIHKCDVCNKFYASRASLGRHKKIHTGFKSPKCVHCDKSFSENWSLAKHIKMVHEPQSDAQSKEKRYFCPICGKGFRTKRNSYLHKLRIHDKVQNFLCHYCSNGFMIKKELEDHIRSHTKELVHKCDLCNKFYATQASLSRHQKIHMGIKSPKCIHCDKTFSENGSLARHLKLVHKVKRSENMFDLKT